MLAATMSLECPWPSLLQAFPRSYQGFGARLVDPTLTSCNPKYIVHNDLCTFFVHPTMGATLPLLRCLAILQLRHRAAHCGRPAACTWACGTPARRSAARIRGTSIPRRLPVRALDRRHLRVRPPARRCLAAPGLWPGDPVLSARRRRFSSAGLLASHSAGIVVVAHGGSEPRPVFTISSSVQVPATSCAYGRVAASASGEGGSLCGARPRAGGTECTRSMSCGRASGRPRGRCRRRVIQIMI